MQGKQERYRQTLHVQFDRHQVTIHTDVPELSEWAAYSFKEMLVPSANQTATTLEALSQNGAYTLYKDGGILEDGASLFSIRRCLRHEVIRAHIDARPDLLWLHAAGAAYRGRAVLMAATYGQGKSTLVTQLCTQGWSYLSDDVVPVDPATGKALPFPLTPYVRQGIADELPPHRVVELARISVVPDVFCEEAQPIGAFVFPIFRHRASTEMVACPPAQATLEVLQRCFNYKQHQGQAVRYLGRLVERLPAFHLSYSNGEDAARQIAQYMNRAYPVVA